MNATDIAAALSYRAEELCRRYLPDGRRQGNYWTIGNLDGDKGRSLYVCLAPPGRPGKWTDASTDEHGDLLDIIQHHTPDRTFPAALAAARAFLGHPPAEPKPAQHPSTATPPSSAPPDNNTPARIKAARTLWTQCTPLPGTHAEDYLHSREITATDFSALRFHDHLLYFDGYAQHLPALVAAVTDNNGTLRGIQRTWLDPKQPKKAHVDQPRKALGHIYGLAVRFSAPSPPDNAPLLVGEGIETVLSLLTAIPGIHAAATLSAGSLASFTLPYNLTRLVIAADNDPAGLNAAHQLHDRSTQLGIHTTTITPTNTDFNDELITLGPDAIATQYRPPPDP